MSNNTNKLIEAFSSGLRIESGRIVDELQYNSIPEWDSVAHMSVIAELEEAFSIMLDTDDIVEMSSVAIAKKILQKYDVVI